MALYRRPAQIPFPAANAYRPEKAALGKILFFEPLLSGSATRPCATCHLPWLSWGDGQARAIGEGQKPLAFRSPTILNLAWLRIFGWDGKFRDLESVAYTPILAPANMANTEAAVIERLSAIPGYRAAFTAAFPDLPRDAVISRRTVEQALATFERTVVSAPAPFDRWIEGDADAITPTAQRGFDLFNGRARCAECHEGWAFTRGAFHDIGHARADEPGRGRLFSADPSLQHAFKTPTLRDVARRAPYMHDGSVPTLEAVIEMYDKGGIDRPSRSAFVTNLGLSDAEKSELVAFLRSLTSDPVHFDVPVLPR
jgi:cytochrome c peroxidase